MFKKKSYLTPNQVAELLMVSPSAIRLWSEKGELNALVTAGGHRRFKLEDIKQFALNKNIQLNFGEQNEVKVLIVDDDPQFACFLKDLLTEQTKDIETCVTHNGFDAGIMVKEFEPTIVLLDINMDFMNGFQVCEKIKQDPLLKHIRIIIISGSISPTDKEQLLQMGVEYCFDKPINVSKLLELIDL